jgi:hypothetical protein
MGDTTTTAAACTQPLSTPSSEEQQPATAAVPSGQRQQVFHLWQHRILCQELSQELAETGTDYKSEPRQEAEGASEARQAELHHVGRHSGGSTRHDWYLFRFELPYCHSFLFWCITQFYQRKI